MNLLEVRALHKSFGARRMLDIAELALQAGESYAVTGENGAGKSTLLRILAGLEEAQIGAFRCAGRDVSLPPYPVWLRREIVYLHQQPYLFHTSVAHNIAYGLRARGVPRQERDRIVREAAQWAGVQHLWQTPPQRLSGGEKQRVALARARVLAPKIFLLDEPTASLDAGARRQVMELIGHLCRENNCVVVACHDRELINLPHMHTLHLQDGKLSHVAAGREA